MEQQLWYQSSGSLGYKNEYVIVSLSSYLPPFWSRRKRLELDHRYAISRLENNIKLTCLEEHFIQVLVETSCVTVVDARTDVGSREAFKRRRRKVSTKSGLSRHPHNRTVEVPPLFLKRSQLALLVSLTVKLVT